MILVKIKIVPCKDFHSMPPLWRPAAAHLKNGSIGWSKQRGLLPAYWSERQKRAEFENKSVMRAEIWGLTMAIREFGCFASQLCQAWSCISLLLFTEQDAQWTGWTAMNLFSKQNELMRASFQSRINWCSLDWVLSSSQCSAFIFSPLGKDVILSVAWHPLRKRSFEFGFLCLFTLEIYFSENHHVPWWKLYNGKSPPFALGTMCLAAP